MKLIAWFCPTTTPEQSIRIRSSDDEEPAHKHGWWSWQRHRSIGIHASSMERKWTVGGSMSPCLLVSLSACLLVTVHRLRWQTRCGITVSPCHRITVSPFRRFTVSRITLLYLVQLRCWCQSSSIYRMEWALTNQRSPTASAFSQIPPSWSCTCPAKIETSCLS